MNQLRAPFIALGAFALLFGIIQLLPGVAEMVFSRPVVDPAVEAGWGASSIMIGLLALGAVRTKDLLAALAWPAVIGLVITISTLIYYWARGAYTAETVLPAIVIDLAIAGWIAYLAARPEPLRRAATG